MVETVDADLYVGTLVGESTSREFRLAVTHDSIREQDIIAVDAAIRSSNGSNELDSIRVWAKVSRIERINPLFPVEAGHELAATRTPAHDTVLSLSREMVTAVCQVLGAEPIEGNKGGRLDQLRYPAKPATVAYSPQSEDIKRIVIGNLSAKTDRALDIATLANRSDVDVWVDGHAIVTRHLAILAMTGAGKSWTARRIIEELASKHYPIVIFDPHGDYSGLGEVQGLQDRVKRYFARFPVLEEDSETIAEIVSVLGYELTPTMQHLFGGLFDAACKFIVDDPSEMSDRMELLTSLNPNPSISAFGLNPDLWLISHLAGAGERAAKDKDQESLQRLLEFGWEGAVSFSKTDGRTLEGTKKRSARAAAKLVRMERTNISAAASGAEQIPVDRTKLVQYNQISVVTLAGYQADFQATIFGIVADSIFDAKLQGDLKLPVLFVLEEAHTFAPAAARSDAERRSIATTRQIAQEGRKFGLGLVVIGQRPSRLDETTLSQCNSYIVMRMANPADQSYVRKVIETLGEDDARLLPDLDVGEALLSGQLINFPVLAKIKEPRSQGEHEEEDAFVSLRRAWQEQQQRGQ